MQWLKKLFGSSEPSTQSESTAEKAQQKTIPFAEAWDEHRAELDNHLTPEIKRRVFLTWSQSKNREAHSYADLVASHPTKSEQIAQFEAETIMQMYLCGYMAKQGWIEDIEALQMPYMLGRRLRDQNPGSWSFLYECQRQSRDGYDKSFARRTKSRHGKVTPRKPNTARDGTPLDRKQRTMGKKICQRDTD